MKMPGDLMEAILGFVTAGTGRRLLRRIAKKENVNDFF